MTLMVEINVWPQGDQLQETSVANIEIRNVSPVGDVADYEYTIAVFSPRWETHTGRIVGFERSRGALALVAAVLAHAGYET